MVASTNDATVYFSYKNIDMIQVNKAKDYDEIAINLTCILPILLKVF